MARDPSLYDDFDWKEQRRTPATQQVVFAWKGEVYEMVLCDANAELFNKTMKAFADCAHTVGIKVPALPKHLRAEFPSKPQPPLDDPVPDIAAALASASSTKPAVPSFAAAVKASPTELPFEPTRTVSSEVTPEDRKVPGGGEIPEYFWVTPKDANEQTRKRFRKLRAEIWARAGHLPVKGNLPVEVAKVAYEWARECPHEVKAVLTSV